MSVQQCGALEMQCIGCDWQSSENFQVSRADPIEFQPLAAVLTHFDMHTGGAMTVVGHP